MVEKTDVIWMDGEYIPIQLIDGSREGLLKRLKKLFDV